MVVRTLVAKAGLTPASLILNSQDSQGQVESVNERVS